MKKFSIFLFFLLFISSALHGHESRPLYLKITNQGQELYFELSVPNTVNVKNLPIVSINNVVLNNINSWSANESGFKQKWNVLDSLL
ncbi:MAG: hypothetical protein L3J52_09400, partial [Proteobacteria bacterium]|nr:hypothetical protein [Pseudomonadota bacterium]